MKLSPKYNGLVVALSLAAVSLSLLIFIPVLAFISVGPGVLLRMLMRDIFHLRGWMLGLSVVTLLAVPVASLFLWWWRSIRYYAERGMYLPKERILLILIPLSIFWYAFIFFIYWLYWDMGIEEDEAVFAVAITIPVAGMLLILSGFLSDQSSAFYLRRLNKKESTELYSPSLKT